MTWVFSGLLSMEPFDWTNASGLQLPPAARGEVTLDASRYDFDFAALAAALPRDVPCEIEFADLAGVPGLIVSSVANESRRVFDLDRLAERTEALPARLLLNRIERSDVGADVLATAVLDDYDAYYYDRERRAPLPVLQVRFDDPADTWYYFDLLTAQPVFANHRLSRIERWLFNGLHSLDFSFWYARRPLWDIGMLLLLGGALMTSSIGLCLGYRRITRSVTASIMRKELRDN